MKKLFFYIINILISLHTFGQGSWLSIEILTDNYPLETSWLLEDENGNVIDQISTGDLVCANTYYNWDIYIDDNICYQFGLSANNHLALINSNNWKGKKFLGIMRYACSYANSTQVDKWVNLIYTNGRVDNIVVHADGEANQKGKR